MRTNFDHKQYSTNLPLAFHAGYPGWPVVSGVNALHAVQSGTTTQLVLFGDNYLNSPQVVPNNAGVKFSLNVTFAPGCLWDASTASLATDAVVITLLTKPFGPAVFTFTAHQTQPFMAPLTFTSQTFTYVGTGIGNLAIQFSCPDGVSGRVCGTVDSAYIAVA